MNLSAGAYLFKIGKLIYLTVYYDIGVDFNLFIVIVNRH